MATIDYVTTCMGRLDFLKQTLPILAAQPDSTCTMVDYSCPDRSGDWVEANFPAVKVVRIPGRPKWNHSEALNAGAAVGLAPWIAFVDCDIRLAPEFDASVRPLLAPREYYRFAPVYDKGIVGTFLCSRTDHKRVGGHDETYREYGEHDLDLYESLEMNGVAAKYLPSSLVLHIFHDDSMRLRRMDVKDIPLALTIGRVYRFMKFDLQRLTGGLLTPAARQALFQAAEQAVRTALTTPQGGNIHGIYKTQEAMVNGLKLERAIQFRLTRP